MKALIGFALTFVVTLRAVSAEAQQAGTVGATATRSSRVRDEIMILTSGEWDDEQLGARIASRLTGAVAPAPLKVRVTSAAGLDGITLPASGILRLEQLRGLLQLDGPRLALALVRNSDDRERITVALLPMDSSEVRVLGTWLVGGFETAATAISARLSADSSFQRVRANSTVSRAP